MIIGDFDSISDDIKHFYEAHSVEIINRKEDQDSTDFEKAVQLIIAREKEN